MPREKQIPGFHYTRAGEAVSFTPSQWRALLSTHTRRVENGETFFQNKAKRRLEYEAYGIIAVK